jgi:hypothetical protein
VIWHQAKRKQRHSDVIGGLSKEANKLFIVFAIAEHALTEIAPVQNMLHAARVDDASAAGQTSSLRHVE